MSSYCIYAVFYQEKITRAIFKAAHACGGEDYKKAEELSALRAQKAEEQPYSCPSAYSTSAISIRWEF